MGMLPVALGNRVPLYPRKAWSRIPQEVRMEDIWQLCGPQVEKHIDALPLWKVFCVVYFEGLMHGAGAERERQAKDTP